MGEDWMNGFGGGQLFFKSDDGEYVPFNGLTTAEIAEPIEVDAPEFEMTRSVQGVMECVLKCRIKPGNYRKLMRQIRKTLNHKKRIKRHEIRLKERVRRARLKGKKWIVLRDKDGGQICINIWSHSCEKGWLMIRQNRKVVWPE